MNDKKQYYGLDILKFVMAILVAMRHIVQSYYQPEDRLQLIIFRWLSNLAVPVFFIIAGFLLFRKISDTDKENGWRIVKGYALHSIQVYILWSVIYLPVDIYNWRLSDTTALEAAKEYIRYFVFSSSIVHLWYMMALAEAVLVVCLLYRAGLKIWTMLIITGALFVVGCICDNWYFTERTPMIFQEFVWWYGPRFMTVRNGIFYGSFYITLGLWLSKKSWKLPAFLSASLSMIFLALMYKEVSTCFNTNMVFMAAPAALCLVGFAMNFRGEYSYPFTILRRMSAWIYFSHIYFFYFLAWTLPWNPIPLTTKKITICLLIGILTFSLIMSVLQGKFKRLSKLV